MRKLAWFGLLAAIMLVPAVAAASSARIRLFPDRVDIGAFFQGVEVTLQGEIPPGAEAVVEIQGAAVQQELLRKGRRGGLWMTVGEIRVENAPNLYLVLSSAPKVPQLDGQETPWGFPALRSRVKFQGALTDQEKELFFKEFLELKKSEELYGTLPGAIKIGNSPEGQTTLKGTFLLPAKVPPGNYRVRLSVVKDGRVLEQKNEELEVKMVGFPALLAAMAYEHGSFYGVVAVLIAIATGFIMGFLFKGKAEH
ncbi:MAG: TIGR02186 family protein [Deltaproteobacteria bacterium]|nr:TIGR02186 family protein [Deltaproteobacteria bacterium]MBI4796684.1 TIGR02186 family protein [Deltaproteobacteria bacterium]